MTSWLGLVVFLVVVALQVCCGSVTDAGKVALRQQRGGTDNKTGPVQEGGGRGGGDCPSLISVAYCPNTKVGNFSFRTGLAYSFLPVNFEVNGVQINRHCRCYNSSAEQLTVYLDRTIGGGNYSFLLSWPYPQCNNNYRGRFEDGQLYMEDGIEVEKDDDEKCIMEDGTGTGTDDANSAWPSVPEYLCLTVPIIASLSTIHWL